jgi:NADPH:quinone reductase-like Zn-dependent oxidoreductase
VVDACGSGILARRLLGKRVAIACPPPAGCWQEYSLVEAKKAVVMPEAISDQQAAMFFVNPLAAYVMIHEVLRVRRGEWVAISAAGSALGKSVVRMGRLYGFKTLCVVRSDSNSAQLRALGADAVIETERQDLLAEVCRITGGQGVQHALDCVGGALASDLLQCLGMNGHLLVYGTLSGAAMQVPGRDLMMPLTQVSGFFLSNWLAQQSLLKLLGVLRAVKKLTLAGVFEAEVTQVFGLEQVAEAVTAAKASGRTGKVMLRLGSP